MQILYGLRTQTTLTNSSPYLKEALAIKAFGFAGGGGDMPGATSGDLTSIQMCCNIVSELFPTSATEVNKLAHSIKNCTQT